MLPRLCLFLQMFVTGMTTNAADIRIAVSDLISDNVLETVQELASASALEISFISIGSLPAMEALRLDEVSLAVIALPDDKELPED